ncbi:MAG: c-type cytochrome [Chloroflexi bacterium]|nr:c-type cytochrome [Chloroflexota bacterium]
MSTTNPACLSSITAVLTALVLFAAIFSGMTVSDVTTNPVPTPSPTIDAVARGESLAYDMGCIGCHYIGSKTAAAFNGLYNSERLLTNETTVIADEVYLRESILDPRAKIPDGYARGIHPSDFRVRLSDQQIDYIIAYIISLADN